MNSSAAIFPSAPAPERGASPPAGKSQAVAEDQGDFGLALQQMLAAPAAAPQPMPQPQLPADASADMEIMDSLPLLAGNSGRQQTESDVPLPAEGSADPERDELLKALSQNESTLSALLPEQDIAAPELQDNEALLLSEGRADQTTRPMNVNQAQQDTVLPTGLQEQAEELKTHLTDPQPPALPPAAANSQAQPSFERSAVQHAEKPIYTEGVSRFEQTLSVVRDGNRLQVSLEPDGFGKLDINLSLEQGVLHARIHVADETSRNLLANHQQQLLDALAKEGLNVGGFFVSLRNSGSGQDGRAFRQDDENATGRSDGPAAEDGPGPGRHRGMVSIFV